MNEYKVWIDFGGRARCDFFMAGSEEEAIRLAVAKYPNGRDFIMDEPEEDSPIKQVRDEKV